MPSAAIQILQPSPLPTLPSEPIEQEIERLPSATRRLAAQLRLPLAEAAVWEVLTDYESLPSFIPNLMSSRLLNREGTTVLLEQIGSQRFVALISPPACGLSWRNAARREYLVSGW